MTPFVRLFSICCIFNFPLFAAFQFEPEGEIALRWDVRSGAGNGSAALDFSRSVPLDDPRDFFFLRTTVGIRFSESTSGWEGLVSVRDLRTTERVTGLGPTEDDLDFYEAFLQYKGETWRIKAGRQELRYGDWLVVGPALYNNGRSFDALRLDIEMGQGTLSLSGGKQVILQSGLNRGEQGASFAGMFFDGTFGSGWDIHAYLVGKDADSSAPGGSRTLVNPGILVKYQPAPSWQGEIHLSHQMGRVQTSAGRIRHEAWNLRARIDHTWGDLAWRPRVGVEGIFSPGDPEPGAGVNRTWDLMYNGGNHGRMGRMDLVSWRNIRSIALRAQARPHTRVTFNSAILSYWMDETGDFFYRQGGRAGRRGNGYGINPELNSFLGRELNVWVQIKLSSHLDLLLDSGFFKPGDYIRQSLRDTGGHQNAWFFGPILTGKF